MKTIMAIISIVIGAGSLPVIVLAGMDKIDLSSKREKKTYKAAGLKIANKLNTVFMLLISVCMIGFGIGALINNFVVVKCFIVLMIVAALGPIGVLVYMNLKWKK